MSVDIVHPLYLERLSQWETMRDCIAGEDAIKAKGTVYLPKALGTSLEQYNAYKTRARFVNYTKRTADGLHGLMFRRDPIVERPDNQIMLNILENIDKRGTSLYQFLSDSVYDTMITGWGGYLVDYPSGAEGLNGLEMEEQDIRPYVRYYPAESIVNWKYGVVNGLEQLTLVVLKEKWDIQNDDDIFVHNIETVYRVLYLKENVYHQILYYQDNKNPEKTKEKWVPVEDIIVKINGKTVNTIPFFTTPGKLPDTPMFLDLAKCNIGHYQKTADYENGVHMTTIPTGFITGHDKYVDPETKEEEAISLGPDNFIMIKEADAKVGVLNYAGEGLSHCEKAIEQAMSDMAILGSRLVSTEKGTSESADAAKIHRAGENARLAGFAKNVSEGISKAVKTIAKWLQLEGNFTVELCTDYDTLSFDPNALNALANLAEAGKMPLPYIFWNLKNGEYTPNSATFKEYIALLNMEAAGIDMFDEAEAYAMLQKDSSLLKKISSLPTKKQTETNANKPEEKIEEE
ncbi:MAG: DUF4055 domain-containing protein [Bacteroidales bacterium]|nr:DUF4055 domain-containing protein [Candidatus Scybalousia scybalohippi]